VNKAKYIHFLIFLFLLSSCSLTKGLKEGEYLVYDVEVEGIDKSDPEAIKNLIIQKPNTRIPFTNFSVGVFIYNLGLLTYDSAKVAQRKASFEEEKQLLELSLNDNPNQRKLEKRYAKVNSQIANLDRKLNYGNWFMRTGNPVILYDSSKTYESQVQITSYLSNHGFFDASVRTEVEKKRRKAFITYQIAENQGYLIDSMFYKTDDEKIARLLEKDNRSLVKEGRRYNQEVLTKERQRVEDRLRDHGYFNFSKSYIEYNVYKDTIRHSVSIEQLVRTPASSNEHPAYTIGDVHFHIDSPAEVILDQEVKTSYNGINYTLYRDRYSEKVIDSRIFLEPGALYRQKDVRETQRQLANLDIFSFVNISFDTVGNQLQTRILTRPNQKFQITNQLGASVTEQLPGPFISHSLRNRNLFRGLEIFEFNFRAGLEGVTSATTEGGVYRSRELSTSASVIFPQFLIPFNNWSLRNFGRYNPRTRALFGYNYVNRPEYVRDALNTILAYSWAPSNLRQQFTINLLDANLIRSSLDPLFRERLEDFQSQGNNLINSFMPSYVSSISGQLIVNFNQYGLTQRSEASLWRIFAESGGTTFNLINNSFIKDRSFQYFQFLKFQSDFRRYRPLSQRSTFAYRLNLGLAKPYGISGGVLPYEKYFFAGGSTSIRAWQPRRLGPGSFTPDKNEDGTFDYRFEQPGEILFEAMFEYRQKLFGYFDGAIFVDVGNTWTFGEDRSRPGADFQVKRFYKELAVGTGLGLRMDFDFLVLRLDMGIKAYDPARPEGERYILDNISFSRPLGEKSQRVFNIGIGYPF
jgi:outer membrane protein insertion porin family